MPLTTVPDEPTMSMNDVALVLKSLGQVDAYLNLRRYIELADQLADELEVTVHRFAQARPGCDCELQGEANGHRRNPHGLRL
jgi:hypothetical protein